MPFIFQGGAAVVTGAASGIGRATARALAARRCDLALADRHAAGLAETAAQAREWGVKVSEHVLDVADAAAVAALPDQVLAEHGKATILINNAGVSLVGTFAEVTLEEFRWLIEINFLAVVALTKGFLPTLMAQPQAQIVNISSIFGIIAPAEQTAYAASKFAVRGFSESLRHELAATTVGVTVVHPGGIKTAIATSARIAAAANAGVAEAAMREFTESALRTPPETAAAAIVGAIQRRSKRLLIGADAQALAAVQRLFPVSYWSVLGRLYQRYVLDERPPEAGGPQR